MIIRRLDALLEPALYFHGPELGSTPLSARGRVSTLKHSSPSPASSSDCELSLTIPLFNEQEGVQDVVSSLQRHLRAAGVAYQLILVDNGSHDGTLPLLRRLAELDPRLEVLSLARNLGYGGGILAGMRLARAPILGYLWGDSQISHYAVVACYQHMRADALDLCKVRRHVRLEGWERQALTRVYHRAFPLFAPRPSDDIHGCPKLFTRSAWLRLSPQSTDWFLDAEIMLKARRLGFNLLELPVVSYPRDAGHSKVRLSTILEFARRLSLLRFRR